MKRLLALSTMLILVVTGCASPRTTLSPTDLPFHQRDPRGFDVRWRLVRSGDQVQVDGLVTEYLAEPVREAILHVRGLDSHERVVSWAWDVVSWSDTSDADRTRPFHMRLRLIGSEERFDVTVSSVDYYEWGG
jgi:hypothetical protein